MRKLLVITFALTALFINPTSAFAHAGLVSSNPVANSTVSFFPKQIKLTFTEDLLQLKGKEVNSLSLTYMKHADLGLAVQLQDVNVVGATLSATIPTGQYETGKYVVAYSIVSADGHKLSDSYSFTTKSFGATFQTATPTATPAPSHSDGNGVLPLPIVGAIAIAVIVGLFVAFGRRNRTK